MQELRCPYCKKKLTGMAQIMIKTVLESDDVIGSVHPCPFCGKKIYKKDFDQNKAQEKQPTNIPDQTQTEIATSNQNIEEQSSVTSNSKHPHGMREIRVFISSTFRDMQEEREELVKRVFPKLRKMCEERGVTWGEVDLRWGITEEQAEKGEVLPICLEEIKRCRPYFIGLLGERYGWVPVSYPEKMIGDQPWLEEHLESSITELEILYGVLNNPEMADHSFFYFRDPAYIENLPDDRKQDFPEKPTIQEIETLGVEEAKRRAEKRRQKLKTLKDRIRESGFPLRENFKNPGELGKLVLDDLAALIDQLFPEEEQPDSLEVMAFEHLSFADNLAGVYVGGQKYFDVLDETVKASGKPLVVLGDSGSGKSALLANWGLSYQKSHPNEFVLMHFIGASPHSANWKIMLRRFLAEFKRRFGIEAQIPEGSDALREAFANWLYLAAEKGRLVLILDALDKLVDQGGAQDLIWLPPELPDDMQLVVSTLPGRPLDTMEERGWPTLELEPLNPAESEELIIEYLAQYSKTLSRSRIERISKAPQTSNPLYLKTLLEELRVFGQHEKLDQRIDHYLEAETVPVLYQKVLTRYEEDYELDCPGLVQKSMSFLWAARRGLSESELLDLLGTDGEPLPQAYWSPLYLAADGSLVNRGGLLGFSHNYLRQAVEERYLPTALEQKAAHEKLANYFSKRELSQRKINELPWQLEQAEKWQRLYDLLSNLNFFRAAWEADEFDIKTRWTQVETNSMLRLVEAYQPVLDVPRDYEDTVVGHIAMLLADQGYNDEMLTLQKVQVERYRRDFDPWKLQVSLGNLAVMLWKYGDLDQAMALSKEQERICREIGDVAGLAGLGQALKHQSAILYGRGELDQAMALMKDQERIFRELGYKNGLKEALLNQAVIYRDVGDLDRAMELNNKVERICRALGDKSGLAGCLGNQALILEARGNITQAMNLHIQVEHICRRLGDKAGIKRSLANQAVIHLGQGDLEEAMALLREHECICRELGDKSSLAGCWGNQALVLMEQGDLEGAMVLHKKHERISRELGDKAGLSRALGNQAVILKAQGRLDEALALHKSEENLCRELGDKAGLAGSLANQSLLLANMGRLHAAFQSATRAYRLANRHGLKTLAKQIKRIIDAFTQT